MKTSQSSGIAAGPRLRRAALRWALAALACGLLATGLAIWQSPGALRSGQPTSSEVRTGLDWWRSPLELNPWRRLPDIPDTLLAMHFEADGRHGWAVGARGTVFSSSDGGEHWSGVPTQMPIKDPLLTGASLHHDGRRAWVVDTNGHVMASQDAGKSWALQEPHSTGMLKGVHFNQDGQRGWVVGIEGALLSTQDGGKRWARQRHGLGQQAVLNSIHFSPDGLHGWAVGQGSAVIATRDGGQTWTGQATPVTQLGNEWRSVHVGADGQRVWVVGSGGLIIASEDGGQHWVVQASQTKAALKQVQFRPDGRVGWIVGDAGTLLNTTDGGKLWFQADSGTRKDLRQLQFQADGKQGWAVGRDGAVLRSLDGGGHWALQTRGAMLALNSVRFTADGRRGWTVGEAGTLLSTEDGGQRWRAEAVETRAALNALQLQADGQIGWAVGDAGSVLLSRDGGRSWLASRTGLTEDLHTLELAADARQAWVLTDARRLLHSADAGATWRDQSPAGQDDVISICLTSGGQRVWAITEHQVFASTDFGKRWVRQTIPQPRRKFSELARAYRTEWMTRLACSADGRRIWAARSEDSLLQSQDAGASWTERALPEDMTFVKAMYLSSKGSKAWAVDALGLLQVTDDDGTHWRSLDSDTRQTLWDIQFAEDGQRGWAVGHAGTLIATKDGGQTWADPRPYRRYPAPWYWVALLLCVPMLLLAQRRWIAAGQAAARMADMNATDAALTRPEQDRLNFAPLAAGISRFLRNPATEPPLTLAITGDWGSGKSSLMGLLCADLRQHGIRSVWFNAWHHQKEEHLFAALLGALRSKAIPPWFSVDGLSFRLRLLWLRSRKHALLSLVLCAALAAAATLHAQAPDTVTQLRWLQQFSGTLGSLAGADKGDKPDKASKAEAPTAAASASVASQPTPSDAPTGLAHWLGLTTILAASLTALRRALTAFGADPAALLAGGAKALSVGLAAEQNSFRTRFAEQFAEVTAALPERLVIVIDDLDRCRPEAVLEIMEAVNFLTSSGECFVIFGMATDKVQAALAVAFERIAKEMADIAPPQAGASDKDEAARQQRSAYAANYLQKLINLEIKVPTAKDFEAWKLLSDDDAASEGRPARSWRSALRPLRRHWPVGALAASVGLGIWAGMLASTWLSPAAPAGEPPAAVSTAAAAASPSASPPTLDKANSPAKPASAALRRPEPEREYAAMVEEGADSQAHVWLSLGGLLAGTGLAALLMLRQMSRRHQQVRDSEDFRHALKLWSELVRAHGGTPRAVKRFGNKLRYFEMLQQGEASDRSLLEAAQQQWRAWRGGSTSQAVAGAGESEAGSDAAAKAPNRQIATPQLVALGALTDAFGPAWLDELGRDLSRGYGASPVQGRPLGSTAQALIERHEAEFRTVWPPSLEEVKVFARLLDGVRLSGEAVELEMRRDGDGAASAASSSVA
ncbi:YCF48-related protein [Paucibacter sp. DJ1R-11]|uniref:YCF48-related protein n=1 Tax=Paucibacter sp. DJ1R-11 TaxID=2893556 RepID=UPI0021E3F6D2|nr:YCF48-related protein [Paucibacter sp. DJ1R-11]MCV2363527.1 YCF48-related protein [Paucibacter sp. DJ1R-11]